MYQRLNNNTSQQQQHRATAHLRQTMHLLEKNSIELHEELQQALDENPALELVEELRCPECGRRLRRYPCQHCVNKHRDSHEDEPLVYFVQRSDTYDFRTRGRGPSFDDDPDPNQAMQERARPVTLAEHVMAQVGPMLSSTSERRATQYILDRLDDRGLLPEHPVEIARFLRLPLATVERALALIHQADPVGVAAADADACLLLQLDNLEVLGKAHPLARSLLLNHRQDMANGQYSRIARELHAPMTDVRAAVRFIRTALSPFPAQAGWDPARDDHGEVQTPDAIFSQNRDNPDGPLTVEIISVGRGWLRVDPEFKRQVKSLNGDADTRLQQFLEQGLLLTKCIQQRNHTMRRILTTLAREQRAFIVHGDAHLVPMTQAALAQALELHESTISRAVSGKAVALPSGRVIPLKQFFVRSLAVQAAVREIIENEDKPLSDSKIAVMLQASGYDIARRTVAKYRDGMGILPASMRRKRKADVTST